MEQIKFKRHQLLEEISNCKNYEEQKKALEEFCAQSNINCQQQLEKKERDLLFAQFEYFYLQSRVEEYKKLLFQLYIIHQTTDDKLSEKIKLILDQAVGYLAFKPLQEFSLDKNKIWDIKNKKECANFFGTYEANCKLLYEELQEKHQSELIEKYALLADGFNEKKSKISYAISHPDTPQRIRFFLGKKNSYQITGQDYIYFHSLKVEKAKTYLLETMTKEKIDLENTKAELKILGKQTLLEKAIFSRQRSFWQSLLIFFSSGKSRDKARQVANLRRSLETKIIHLQKSIKDKEKSREIISSLKKDYYLSDENLKLLPLHWQPLFQPYCNQDWIDQTYLVDLYRQIGILAQTLLQEDHANSEREKQSASSQTEVTLLQPQTQSSLKQNPINLAELTEFLARDDVKRFVQSILEKESYIERLEKLLPGSKSKIGRDASIGGDDINSSEEILGKQIVMYSQGKLSFEKLQQVVIASEFLLPANLLLKNQTV